MGVWGKGQPSLAPPQHEVTPERDQRSVVVCQVVLNPWENCFSGSKMFQLQRWSKGVVQREGRNLKITVSPPKGLADGVVLAIIFLPMAYGFSVLFFLPMLRVTSPVDFLWKASAALLFGAPFFLVFRWIFERQFAEQVVTVGAGRITWTRNTKWWTRRRYRNADELTDVSASTAWSGLGRVYITAKGHRHTILDQILNEDAVRFALEVKQSAREI
jgi:hypothetical protein